MSCIITRGYRKITTLDFGKRFGNIECKCKLFGGDNRRIITYDDGNHGCF